MPRANIHMSHHPNNDVREGSEPGSPRVEPDDDTVEPNERDEGPAPVRIPDDRTHDRVIDPAAGLARPVRRTARQSEVAQCP